MKLIFNTSMPRAGSELLQTILHQNPRIYGSSTSPLLEYQFAASKNFELPEVKSQNEQLMKSAFMNMCSGMAISYYKVLTDREIVCDKNRGWIHYYEWVNEWNPNPKMICMVRDLRSIISSMEKIYRKNKHTGQRIEDPLNLVNITIQQRAKYWLDTAPIALAVHRIFDAFQRGINGKILFIKYEELCNHPEKTMKKIYEYIDEPNFEHNFLNIKKEIQEDHTHFGIYGNHNISNKLNKVGYNDWSDILPQNVCTMIKNTYSWYFDAFEY